jgi:hypothetical protein
MPTYKSLYRRLNKQLTSVNSAIEGEKLFLKVHNFTEHDLQHDVRAIESTEKQKRLVKRKEQLEAQILRLGLASGNSLKDRKKPVSDPLKGQIPLDNPTEI